MNEERELLEKINAFVLDKHLTISEFEMETEIYETFLEVRELLAQPEPFKPDWDNYKQGVADSKREPINHDDILDRSINGSFEYRDGFMDGVMFAENHHNITTLEKMMSNLEEMKQRLEEIKLQASGWLSSTDGSYEACLNAMGYYTLQKKIQLEELSNEN